MSSDKEKIKKLLNDLSESETQIQLAEKQKNTAKRQLKLANEQLQQRDNAQMQLEEKHKALEFQLKEKSEAYEKLVKLDKEKSEACRRQAICKTCKEIYEDPIELPCSNTICKSHFKDFIQSKCSFCLQYHEMSLNVIKSNESLNKSIKICLHLNQNEKQVKDEIEKLLETSKRLSE